MCTWRNSSLELDTFAPSILHPLAIMELPIHSLAAYVIVFKTPSRMASVKRTMLAMHLCGAYLDLFLSALSTQFFLLPAAAGYSQGLYTYLGVPVKWQAYMFISAICLAGVSILAFFESRFNSVVRARRTTIFESKWRLLYIGGHYFYAFTFILPITFTPPDQEFGKQYVKGLLPCIPDHVLNHPNFFVYAIDITLLAWIISIAAIGITSEVIFFFFRIVIYLSSTKAKSQRTHRLQVQFFIALCVQISIPLLVVICPVGYIVWALSNGYFDQALNNISLNMMAFHGLVSSLVMLTVHRPYRQAVLNLFSYPCTYITSFKSNNQSQVVQEATIIVVSGYR